MAAKIKRARVNPKPSVAQPSKIIIMAFIAVFMPKTARTLQHGNASQTRRRCTWVAMSSDSKDTSKKRGLFGRIKEAVLRPIVTVPGGGIGGALIECVFCKGSGMCDCDGCNGSGKDAMGPCLMCDGKTRLECTVCSGVGTVDRVRRGGTDDKNEYTLKKKI